MKTTTKLWIGLAILIALSPLGILLPQAFQAAGAGGEKLSQIWRAPLPDYAIKGWEQKGLGHSSIAYIISAASGIAVVALLMFLIGRILTRKRE